MSEAELWTDEASVLTTGALSVKAAAVATAHVARAQLARQALASRVKAQADPDGDAWRVLAYVYASTPVAILRPGALAAHCGLSEDRAREVLDALIGRSLVSPGATTTRVSVIGPTWTTQAELVGPK